MKKFLFIAFAVLSSLTFTSCNTQFGLAYGVKLTGDGDGQFEVVFPQGSYAMDGKAAIALNVGDSLLFNTTDSTNVALKNDVILRGKKKELEAMKRVNDSIATQFEAFSGDGTYDLWLNGYVKELGTGLIFQIDRHFTNRLQAPRKVAAEGVTDPYPYIK